MHNSKSDAKLQSPLMCSDNKCLEILIILDICLFLMSNDSSDTSLGDIDAIVLNNQSGEM